MAKHVLIIEDNEQNRYLLRFILEKNHFSVVEAEDGQSGLEMARDRRPDLILLDIQLPSMDGLQVARELRRNDELDGVPIVAVTSHAMAGDRERVLAAGCDGYMEKPLRTDTLISELQKYLQ